MVKIKVVGLGLRPACNALRSNAGRLGLGLGLRLRLGLGLRLRLGLRIRHE